MRQHGGSPSCTHAPFKPACRTFPPYRPLSPPAVPAAGAGAGYQPGLCGAGCQRGVPHSVSQAGIMRLYGYGKNCDAAWTCLVQNAQAWSSRARLQYTCLACGAAWPRAPAVAAGPGSVVPCAHFSQPLQCSVQGIAPNEQRLCSQLPVVAAMLSLLPLLPLSFHLGPASAPLLAWPLPGVLGPPPTHPFSRCMPADSCQSLPPCPAAATTPFGCTSATAIGLASSS